MVLQLRESLPVRYLERDPARNDPWIKTDWKFKKYRYKVKNRFFRLTAIAVFLSAPLFADPPEGYNQAIEHYNAGRFDKSLEVIRGIFEANKNSYEVRMLAAANHANLRNYDAAIQHMHWIKDHPEKVEAKVLFASILRKSGHFYDAIRVARSVLDAGTENLPLRMELARSLYRVGQYAPARQQVEKILTVAVQQL